jgi:hypothetical protein
VTASKGLDKKGLNPPSEGGNIVLCSALGGELKGETSLKGAGNREWAHDVPIA